MTLVNALQSVKIECLLLEARDEVAPKIGTTIGFDSTAGRIFDQMGVWDDLLEQSSPFDSIEAWRNGKMIHKTDLPTLVKLRYA